MQEIQWQDPVHGSTQAQADHTQLLACGQNLLSWHVSVYTERVMQEKKEGQ